MSVKFDTVKAGDLLWDYHSERAGNTTMRRWGNWPVRIIEITSGPFGPNGAKVTWNGNPPQWWSKERIQRLRRTKGKEARS